MALREPLEILDDNRQDDVGREKTRGKQTQLVALMACPGDTRGLVLTVLCVGLYIARYVTELAVCPQPQ